MDELDRVRAGVDRHRQRMDKLSQLELALDFIIGTRNFLSPPGAGQNIGKLIVDPPTDSKQMD